MPFKRQPHFQQQPFHSRQCGQTCLAILTGVSREEICRLLGKKGGTCYRDIRDTLAALGHRLEKTKRFDRTPILGQYAFIRMRFVTSQGRIGYHWVLYWEGTLLDPSGPGNQMQYYGEDAKFLSFAEIRLA